MSIDLNEKTYIVKSFTEILQDGWRVTKLKLEADFQPQEEGDFEKYEDLMEFYKTSDEKEIAIILPVPTPEQ